MLKNDLKEPAEVIYHHRSFITADRNGQKQCSGFVPIM